MVIELSAHGADGHALSLRTLDAARALAWLAEHDHEGAQIIVRVTVEQEAVYTLLRGLSGLLDRPA